MTEPKHPMQPVVIVDETGRVARFKRNAIVCHLLDHGGIDLNDLARMHFSPEDYSQFAQLIGYSVSGYADLSYADEEVVARADAEVEKLLGKP